MSILENKSGKKVGKALSILCGLFILVNAFNLISNVYYLFNLEQANSAYAANGYDIVLTYSLIIYQMVMSLLIMSAAFFVLKGNKIGIFIYLGTQFIGIIYILMANTLTVSYVYSLVGMVLLLAWLIYRKKDVFF